MAKVVMKHESTPEQTGKHRHVLNPVCKRGCCWKTLQTLLLILVYFSLSIGLTFYQRSLLKGFHFPLTVSVCHMSVKFMCAGLFRALWSCYSGSQRVHVDWKNYLARIAPMGIASGLDIGFSNWGLEFITVSLYTMTKSTSIIFILGFALLFQLEKKSWTLVGIVVSISIGLFLFTYKATQFILAGFLLVLAASFISGLRWTLAQLVMQKSSLGLTNPIDLLYHVQPMMIVAIFPFAVAFEGTAMASSCRMFRYMDIHVLGTTVVSILTGALLAFGMEISEYMVVTYTSSLTLSVAGIVKEISTLVLAVLGCQYETEVTADQVMLSNAFVNPNKPHSIMTKRQARKRPFRSQPSTPTDKDLEAAVAFAKDTVSRMGRLETNLVGADVRVKQGTPAHGQLIDASPCVAALQQGRHALVAVKASLYLAHNHCRKFGLDEAHCAKYISGINMSATSLGGECPSSTTTTSYCDATSKYRSYDGACNHYQQGVGVALAGYRRLLPPDYGDAMQLPRENSAGRALPSARLISTRLARDGNSVEEDKTLALMQWSQFVEHDLTHTPASKMSNTGSSIVCCQPDGNNLKPRYIHPSCLPVAIPQADPVYSSRRVRCMNYVRSLPAVRRDCSFGPLEQMNQATHFLDGSMIYGTTTQKARSLRQFVQGRLTVNSKDGRSFLPSADQPTNECQVTSDTTTCYKSGDVRVNAHPHMSVMYTLWHREHNRLAGLLASLNPHWSDETLYQEARRLVVAEIQHITYSEWLPLVLGEKYSKKKASLPYDSRVDPSVSNSFSTAALRFPHSMMESRLRLYDEKREANASHTILLREHFNRPRIVEEPGHLDSLVRGLATQSSQKSDMDYVADITSLLYQDSNPYGLDIISLDVQRGRDHGLPGYNKYRKLCGLPAASNFDHFTDVIPKQTVAKLRAVYSHPDDVDLLIGGMSEQPAADSLLGATFRCILGEQFARTRAGDRFFYNIRDQPQSFTQSQLRTIETVTLARIFCDNGDDIKSMQPNVFRKPSTSNEIVDCKDESRIPRLDTSVWQVPGVAS